ncbi:ankyrin [Parathielavia hyrcaniae]|uniref:Ankyrin n=1 Tax=Parathielavia hyrcaniae TaxID=113614 RepID=A0AAN6Q173_9PEZI|nr:ankyrin [Parathielavia hyrcaniae]
MFGLRLWAFAEAFFILESSRDSNLIATLEGQIRQSKHFMGDGRRYTKRRGVKNHAIAPSDRTLRSMSRQTASSPEIERDLEETELWALSLQNRRLSNVATPYLWKNLYNNPLRCREVLLWCAQVGQNDLLKGLLDRNTSRRQKVARRDLQGEVLPSKTIRRRVRSARKKANLSLEITDGDLDWILSHAWQLSDAWHSHYSLDHFGVSERPEANNRHYWYGAPVNIAAKRHNDTAFRMLLDNGADIDAQCSGLCDCAAPPMDGEDHLGDSVEPRQDRSVWTALHVAMCSGNEEAVLLDEPRSRPFLNTHRDRSPLIYAAAGGHIRIVGKYLLDNGAIFHDYEGLAPDQSHLWPGRPAAGLYTRVLVSLCVLQKPVVFSRLSLREQQDQCYAQTTSDQEARDELKTRREKAVRLSRQQRISLTRNLLGLGADPNLAERTHFGSLPVTEPKTHQLGFEYRTSLQLAARSGFTEMVRLLTRHGANCDKVVCRVEGSKSYSFDKPARELPLMYAILNALARARLGETDTSTSILVALQSIKSPLNPAIPQYERVRLSIVEMVLHHGGATVTTKEDWERIVLGAYTPGNLAY